MSEVIVKQEPTSPKEHRELQTKMWWGVAQAPGSPKSAGSGKSGSFEGKSQRIGGGSKPKLTFSIPPELPEKVKTKMLKSEFIRSHILSQKESKREEIKRMSDEDYLRSEFYESTLKSIMDEDEAVYPKQLKDPDPVVLTGAHTFIKKKFCGSALVTEYVDITFTKDKELSVSQSQSYGGNKKLQQSELDKIKSLLPKDLLAPDNLEVKKVDDIVQKLNHSKAGGASSKAEDQLRNLYLPQGSRFEYVIPGRVANQQKLDVLIRDRQQSLETSKMLLNNAIYASQYLSQFRVGDKADIRPLITIWKAKVAEGLLDTVDSKKNRYEARITLNQKLISKMRRTIRIGIFKKFHSKTLKNDQTMVARRLGALRNIFMLQELAENSENMKIALTNLRRFTGLARKPAAVVSQPAISSKPKAPEHIEAPTPLSEILLQVAPNKLFLSPYTKPNVKSEVKDLLERLTNPDFQTIDELEILVSEVGLNAHEIDMHYKTEKHFKVERIPVPYSADLPIREFDLFMKKQNIDLKHHLGQFLVVYLKNLDGGKVWAHGSSIIYNDFGDRITIDLHDYKGTKVGSVVFKIVNAAVKTDVDHPLIKKQLEFARELIHPNNFSMLKKLDQAWAKDRGLGRITGVSSINQEYQTLKDKMLSKIHWASDLTEYEDNNFRIQEWTEFEEFFKDSVDYARKVNQRHSHPIIEQNEERPVTLATVNPNQAPTRQHSLRRGVSEYQPRLPADQFVLERTEFRHRAEALNLRIPQAIETDSSLYLYSCLIPWELTLKNKGHLEVLERALSIGVPTTSLIRVWKSVGKSVLCTIIIHDVCAEILPRFESNRPYISQLDSFRHDMPVLSSQVLQSIDNISDVNTPEEKMILLTVLRAFSNLSYLIRNFNSRFVGEGPLRQALAGFNLNEPTVQTLNLVRHILRVSAMTHKSQAINMRAAIEQDVFWVLTSLAFVVLPEHFLDPDQAIQALVAIKDDEEASQAIRERQTCIMSYIKKLDSMGTSLEKLLRKKSPGLGMYGTHKVASLFAQLVYKELPAVYYAMAELGFPFTAFASEMIDSMFCSQLNFDTLNKLWSVMFFEGASSQKRRAQQIMLSALVTKIHLVKKTVLESKSVKEMMWYIKAGTITIQSSDFIQRVRSIQRKHFMSSESQITLISEIGKFIKGNKSMEETWKDIVSESKIRLLPIKVYLKEFQNQLGTLIESKQKAGHVDITILDKVCEHFSVQQALNSSSQLLKFVNKFSQAGFTSTELGARKAAFEIHFGLSGWDFGEYLPGGSIISAESPFLRNPISMKINQRSWYNMHIIPCMKDQTIDHVQIVINLKLTRFSGDYAELNQVVELSDFDLNQESFFEVRLGNALFIFYIHAIAPENNIHGKDYFENLCFDPQIRQNLFAENLANHLKIPKRCFYETELIQSEIADLNVLEQILNLFCRTEEQKLMDQFKKSLSQNLLNSMKTNLFEVLVPLVLTTPRTIVSALKNLFGILNKLDQTYQKGRVKVSHVSFLVWYLCRLAGFCHPLHEINCQIYSLLSKDEPQVLSGIITPLDEGTKLACLDITELLNIWLVAERKRTGRYILLLGERGNLNLLRDAMTFWQQETGMQPHTFTQQNKLRVVFKSTSGRVNTVEYLFDRQMRVVFEHKHLDVPVTTPHVVMLQDGLRTVRFELFAQLMNNLPVVDRVFHWFAGAMRGALLQKPRDEGMELLNSLKKDERNPLSGFGGFNGSSKGRSAGVRMQYFWQGNNDKTPFVVVLFGFDNSGSGVEEKGIEKFKDKLQIYMEKKAEFTTPINRPLPDIRVRGLADYFPLINLARKGVRVSIEQFLGQLDIEKFGSPCSDDVMLLCDESCLEIRLMKEPNFLSQTDELTPLTEYLNEFHEDNLLTLRVEVKKPDRISRKNFPRLAKNIYDLEGVSTIDNSLSPCSVIETDGMYSTVVFYGTSSQPVKIPTDQLI